MRTLIGVGLTAGIGLAAVAWRRAAAPSDDFYATATDRGSTARMTGPTDLEYTYHRSEQVVSLHSVDLESARALLPSDALHPVRLPNGRALLAISGARYVEGTAPGRDTRDMPYGESMITILVTPEPSPPLVPIVRGLMGGHSRPPYGGYLWHMAVTNRVARDTSRELGYPCFVADFAFEDDLAERRLRVSEGGREILLLTTAARGRISPDRAPMTVYNVRGDRLFETVCPCSGYAQQHLGRGSGRLELGDHPVADELRALRPSAEAVVTRSYLNLRIRIPPGHPVGPARPKCGYAGSDGERGMYSIRYPDGSIVDLDPPPRMAITAPAGPAVAVLTPSRRQP